MEKMFLAFVAGIMGVEQDDLSLDTAYKHYDKWDSLMMVRLIMELEDEYDIVIPLEEITAVNRLADLYAFTQAGRHEVA